LRRAGVSPAAGGRPARARLGWAGWTALLLAPVGLAYYADEQRAFLAGPLSRGQVFGRDFLNYWAGARLLLEGHVQDAFVKADYARALARLWGPGLGLQNFSYPPSVLPVVAWTGALPYGVALALWCAGGLALLLAAAWPASRRPALAIGLVLSPAVMACLDDGQNGLITAALIVGGLRLVERRPTLGGVLLGLATFKPQLGLLIPLALIAAGRWRAFAAAAASAVGLIAVSVLVAGVEPWRLYLTAAGPFQRDLLEHHTGAFQLMTPSPFMAGRLLGWPLAGAYALQAAASLAAGGLAVWWFRRLRREGRPIAAPDILLLVAAGFIASPYGFNYDMAGLAAAILLTERAEPALGKSTAWRASVALLWLAPAAMFYAPRWLKPALGGYPPVGPAMTAVGVLLLVTALARRGRIADPSAGA
jgi:hypothetical protein